jgi:diguanylate cyclase (GGDEF)-like protein
VRNDPRFAKRFDEQLGYETRSVLALPLKVRDRCLGVIELVNGPGDKAFDAESLRTLAALGDYATIAIDNARNFSRVQELTVVDEHTGLHNARHLRATLDQEVMRAERFRHPLSLIFIDIDHFKQVNDNHGHLVGSEVLREVGERLTRELRGTDVPTRYGGDEFAVILPETSPEAAMRAAKRLQEAIAAAPFARARGLELPVTASFGVATMPDHAVSAEQIIRAADSAMYRAKQLGRNTVAVARPPTHGQ